MTAPHVLVVCTGNICRSPLAEQALATRLRPLGVRVGSAGTAGWSDVRATDQIIAEGRRHGLDLSGHRASPLDREHLRGGVLMLGAERGHRSAAIKLVPRVNRSGFTVLEFARLVEHVSDVDLDSVRAVPAEQLSERLGQAVHLVSRVRGEAPAPRSPADDDIRDPFQQSDAVYRSSAQTIVSACDRISSYLERALTV